MVTLLSRVGDFVRTGVTTVQQLVALRGFDDGRGWGHASAAPSDIEDKRSQESG
jgi:hypothetical protein